MWPVNLSSVWVEQEEIKLIPHYTHSLSFSIKIDDALANYYFGERPWDPIDRWVFKESFKDRFAGYSYLVRVEFDNGIVISDTFEIVTPSDLKELAKTAERGKAIISELLRGKVSTSEGISALVTSGRILIKAGINGTGKFLWGIGNFILAGADVHDWFLAPKPSDGDSNNIVGG